MNPQLFALAISIIASIIASYLTYFFAIKGKLKDVDIQKERKLKLVASNLLVVWEYLQRLKRLFLLLNGQDQSLLIPLKYAPLFIVKAGLLNDKCFIELENNIEALKPYDPLTFYKLEGTGRHLDFLRKSVLIPLLRIQELTNEQAIKATEVIFKQPIDEIEDLLKTVSRQIGNEFYKKINKILTSDAITEKYINDLKKEINQKFYEYVLPLIPKQESPLTYPQFEMLAKDATFIQSIEIVMKAISGDQLNNLLDIVSKNPSIAINEIQKHLNVNNLTSTTPPR